MEVPRDSPHSRPHPGQQWEESSAKFHLSDVFTTLSIILIITIPHEGGLLTIFRRAEGGLGTEGWGPAFLSVLSQTRELPDNYHFLVIGSTNRVIHMCSKVTFLLISTYLYSIRMGSLKTKSNKSHDATYRWHCQWMCNHFLGTGGHSPGASDICCLCSPGLVMVLN